MAAIAYSLISNSWYKSTHEILNGSHSIIEFCLERNHFLKEKAHIRLGYYATHILILEIPKMVQDTSVDF